MAKRAHWLAAVVVASGLCVPGAVSGQEVYQTSELTEAPSLKSAQQAQRAIQRSYPQALQSSGIGGTVQIQFVVAADGHVAEDSIEVLATSSKVLADAATRAVASIEFNPGKKDGQPVASVVVMPIRYAVQ